VDAEGLAYWSGALAQGTETRGSLLDAILHSAHTFEGNAQYGWVADLLSNKFEVGKLFAVDMGLTFNTSEESISRGMEIAAAVTPTDTDAAVQLIGVAAHDLAIAA
jgi:serralysin